MGYHEGEIDFPIISTPRSEGTLPMHLALLRLNFQSVTDKCMYLVYGIFEWGASWETIFLCSRLKGPDLWSRDATWNAQLRYNPRPYGNREGQR